MDDAREILAAVSGGTLKAALRLDLPEVVIAIVELDEDGEAVVAWCDGPRADVETYPSLIQALATFADDLVERVLNMADHSQAEIRMLARMTAPGAGEEGA